MAEPKTKAPKNPELMNQAEIDAAAEIAAKNDSVMGKILTNSVTPPSIGDLVEGPVIAVDKKGVFIDLAPYGTGIIFGREYINARDIIRKVNIGDKIAAKVVDLNNADGYVELSLK